MGKLEDLRISLLDMHPDEVRERIRFIRQDRRLSKQTEKMPKVRREKKASSIRQLMKGMTPAQLAQLLKELGG